MAETVVKVEGLEDVQHMLTNLRTGARFAASIGINRTMDEAQAAIRQGLGDRFTLRRRAFVERTIYRKPGEDFASKTHLIGRVRVHDERDFLAKFERGGQKEPTRGRSALAVPVNVRRNKADIVTRANRVAALLQSGKAFVRGRFVFQKVGRGKRASINLAYVFKRRTPLPDSLRFAETGTRIILQRGADNIRGAIQAELDRGLTYRSGASK